MHVLALHLINFRNYARLDLELPVGPVIIHGANAQGKSNLLDAFHVLATGRSLRGGPEAAWINVNAPAAASFARIQGHIAGTAGDDHVEVVVARMSASSGVRRRVRIGGDPRRLADLPGRLQAVSFAPSDLTLLTGPPRERRRWLDIALAQLDRDYLGVLADYDGVITRRNAVLRRIRTDNAQRQELRFWDERLVPLALRVLEKRTRFVSEMKPHVSCEYQLIARDVSLEVSYEPTSPTEDRAAYADALQDSQNSDIERGSTGIGPHRDDLVFRLDALPLASFGSQGQIRLAGIALKLAQFAVANRRTKERPVLLLDDVAAELDPSHRRSLLDRLAPATQTLITTADPAGLDVPALADAPRLLVRNGTVSG
jgi:DNA replication and repair protein RecF